MRPSSTIAAYFDRHFGVIALMPALIALAFVLVYPVVVSIGWSFTNMYIPRDRFSFVGLTNYFELLRDGEVFVSLCNGLIYTFCTICLQILLGTGAALLLDRFLPRGIEQVFRLLYMIPWTFPVIVTVLVWGWLFQDSGIISQLLFNLGLIKEPMSFLAAKATAMPSIVFVHSWTGFPLMMMSTLAGLQSIPKDQYEVAALEGAKAVHVFWYVIIPNIKRILQVIIVLRCVWIFNNFNLIFLLTGGGPGRSTQNLPIMAYKYGWESMQVGKSSAVSVVMLIILFLAFLLYARISNKSQKDDANVL
jgi:multiple sugar transport system permease protein